MSPDNHHSWICAQIGSREHYAIPRALHEAGRLRLFLTDFWAEGEGIWRCLPAGKRRKVEERLEPSLADAHVLSLGDRRLFFDLRQKLFHHDSWETTMQRNEWFQDAMLRLLQGPCRKLVMGTRPGTFFSYSYAARNFFAFFRSHGWRTVLGQIDPGPREEEIVARETGRENEYSTAWKRAPEAYWENWKDECRLADEIWVNSRWSSEALIAEGVPEAKITVVPLAHSSSSREDSASSRTYPSCFSSERPMRVLFLGQINLRKGAHLLLRAAQRLSSEPIEFWMVGPTDMQIPAECRRDSHLRWTGPVSRKETAGFYREADLFILPTLSDGFALTQLEAQANHLPLLASRFCGRVVRDGENGLLLDPLTEDTIVEKLRFCLCHPEALAEFSRQSEVAPEFQSSALREFLNTSETTAAG